MPRTPAAGGARSPTWGHRQRGYAELEAGVAELLEYHQSVIPGLLQTPDYTRTRVLSELPIHGRLDVEAEVAARQARQAVLTADDRRATTRSSTRPRCPAALPPPR